MDVAHTTHAGNFFEGDKGQLRAALEAKRRALTPQEVTAKGSEAQRHLGALPSFLGAKTLALYAAQSFEVPTSNLWRGARICFPRVNLGSRVLTFHQVESMSDLVVAGRLSLLEPPADAPLILPDEVDVWVVPGVGFTRQGDRLGRGAGYYDATLALARASAVKIGLTFDCCVVDALPTEPHDIRMDKVVTESGWG